MDLDQMKAEITRLDGLHKAAEADKSKLAVEVADLTAKLSEAGTQLTSAKADSTKLTSERDSLTAQVADLTGELKTAADDAAKHSADFDARLQSRLKEELPKAAAQAGFTLVPARADGKPDHSKLSPRERLEAATAVTAERYEKKP